MRTPTDFIIKLYRRMGLYTCSSVFLLFVLGALVRATGSGMGCPDWPKCFGMWSPPQCECDLPANYQNIFLEKRLHKVERLAVIMNQLGMHKTAQDLRNDPSIRIPEVFHPVKAWIEYINRLFGVLAGLFGFCYLALMVFYRKRILQGKAWGVLAFMLLILNGWLGSLVVSTNLLHGIVTLHFLLSFLCLFAFMASLHAFRNFSFENADLISSNQYFGLWVSVFLIVIMGAWTREQVDVMRMNGTLYAGGEKDFLGYGILNVYAMDFIFSLHRYLPFLLLGWMIFLLKKAQKTGRTKPIGYHNPLMVIAALASVQIALGIFHIWFVVPAWTQVLHVVVAGALISIIFALYLSSRTKVSFLQA